MAVDIHTVQSQIENLENLGLTIEDKRKAEEILSDIGYYRLGFYCFPFEQNYPAKKIETTYSEAGQLLILWYAFITLILICVIF